MKGNVVRKILEDANEKFDAFIGGQNLSDEEDGCELKRMVRGLEKM